MSVYTEPNRVGLWCTDASRAVARRDNIAKLWNGLFTDVFLPGTATRAEFDEIRKTVRPDGSKLKAQLWAVPGKLAASDFAQRVSDDIARLNPGAVDLDIEVADAQLADYFAMTVAALRSTVKVSDTQFGRPKMLLRLSIAPYKGAFLPVTTIQQDPNLFVIEQSYYGNMERVSEAEAICDLLDHGIPRAKAAVCYGAQDERRDRLVLPTLFYEGRLVRKLASCQVFSDDLLAELNLV